MEVDIRITKDEQVICCHDESLLRLTGVKSANVSDYNFDDLPPFKQSIKSDIMNYAYTQTEDDDGKWLKLEDLFSNMPQYMLYTIDLKNGTKRDAQLVYAIVKAYGIESQVIWGSSKSETHSYLLELDSQIARYYNEMAVTKTALLHTLGLLFLFPLENDAFFPPIMAKQAVKREKEIREYFGGYYSRFRYLYFVYGTKLVNAVGFWMYA